MEFIIQKYQFKWPQTIFLKKCGRKIKNKDIFVFWALRLALYWIGQFKISYPFTALSALIRKKWYVWWSPLHSLSDQKVGSVAGWLGVWVWIGCHNQLLPNSEHKTAFAEVRTHCSLEVKLKSKYMFFF